MNSAQALRDSGYRLETLANGTVAVIHQRPTAGVVAISLAFRSGARDESAAEEGSRNLLTRAHLLGTERWPTEDLLRRTVNVTGGGVGASTSRELTQFSITVPHEEFDLAIDVLRDILMAPLFEPDQLERDRRLVLQDISRRLAEPSAVAIDTLTNTVWAGHPAGHSTLGSAESVDSVSRDELLSIRGRTLVGANATVAVVGQIDPNLASAGIERALGGLPAGDPILREPSPIPLPATTERVERSVGQRQALLFVGVPIAGRDDPDRYPLLALDAVLGSPAGRLFGEIRTKRGLAYSAGSGVSFLADTGLFYASAGTDPANVGQVEDLIQAELARAAEMPLQDDELAAAIGQLIGRRVMSEETSGAQAGQLAALVAFDAFESNDEYQAAIRRVTSADIQRTAQRFLTSGRWIVIVRPDETRTT